MSESPSILVIEDEYFLQADLEKVLTDAGFATDIVSSGEEALTLLMSGTKHPNLLVTDVELAGRLSGWEVAKRIREKDASFPVVYVTAYKSRLGGKRRPEQHHHPKALCGSATGDRHFQSSQRWNVAERLSPKSNPARF